MAFNGLNSGHVIVALSAVFFAAASYAILFSGFIPLTGIYVRFLVVGFMENNAQPGLSPLSPGFGCIGTRHALQIFLHAGHPNEHLFCHCELGGMAVLPQFVTHSSVRLIITLQVLQKTQLYVLYPGSYLYAIPDLESCFTFRATARSTKQTKYSRSD